ncbi:hypothetical protein CC80DRAFT_215674 [Byssothecium circinans]|uniref:Uncharacterized protein n=1 Tax=Byssothecium circinans TaxID=147558 RepID=A0A6A5TFW2_9PLEO|nr:hypothetical protein CC80DRAFT_215674 [Byssothecium circinans]
MERRRSSSLPPFPLHLLVMHSAGPLKAGRFIDVICLLSFFFCFLFVFVFVFFPHGGHRWLSYITLEDVDAYAASLIPEGARPGQTPQSHNCCARNAIPPKLFPVHAAFLFPHVTGYSKYPHSKYKVFQGPENVSFTLHADTIMQRHSVRGPSLTGHGIEVTETKFVRDYDYC